MLLLNSEALSAVAQGPASRRERVMVHPVDIRIGVRAGQLLVKVGAGSELAVDVFLIAVADLAGDAVVATVDLNDLRRLAAYANQVSIVGLAP